MRSAAQLPMSARGAMQGRRDKRSVPAGMARRSCAERAQGGDEAGEYILFFGAGQSMVATIAFSLLPPRKLRQ